MGRTNPTYRDWLDRTEQRWQPFRRALRRSIQGDFDRLFERAASHADAAGYLNDTEPEHVMLLSVLLAQEQELGDLADRLQSVEDRLQAVGDRCPDGSQRRQVSSSQRSNVSSCRRSNVSNSNRLGGSAGVGDDPVLPTDEI